MAFPTPELIRMGVGSKFTDLYGRKFEITKFTANGRLLKYSTNGIDKGYDSTFEQMIALLGQNTVDNTDLNTKEKVFVYKKYPVKNTNGIVHIANCSCSLLNSPTGNCQISSVQYFNHLNGWGEILTKEILASFWMATDRKRMLLIDVNSNFENFVETIFPGQLIHTKFPYKSTNGSAMILYFVRTSELEQSLIYIEEPKPEEVVVEEVAEKPKRKYVRKVKLEEAA